MKLFDFFIQAQHLCTISGDYWRTEIRYKEFLIVKEIEIVCDFDPALNPAGSQRHIKKFSLTKNGVPVSEEEVFKAIERKVVWSNKHERACTAWDRYYEDLDEWDEGQL